MPRPLKIYTVESRSSYLGPDIIAALGLPPHVQQGNIFVVARTKKDAAQYISDALRNNTKPHEIWEGTGNGVDAIREGNFLNRESEIIITSSNSNTRVLARGLTASGWEHVGDLTYADPDNPRRTLPKPRFVSNYAERVARQNPVRIVVELDWDTDPAVIEKLRASAALHIMASTDGSTALGKVVQS